MRTILRDELDDFLSQLSLNCHSGMNLNAEEVKRFAELVGGWRDLAKDMEFQISQLGWNLKVRTEELRSTNALLRNSPGLAEHANTILDAVDDLEGNVVLFCPPSTATSNSGGDAV